MLSRMLRVSFYGAGVVIGLLAVTAISVYGLSERAVKKTYDAPLSSFSAPDDPALVMEGERQARIRGCVGCHGLSESGEVFVYDEPHIARLAAGNLTRIAAEYSDAEFERVVRRGVRRDGKSVWAMPSSMYAHLTDDDLAAILAYVRSLEPRDGPPSEFRLRSLGRLGIVLGEFKPMAEEAPHAAASAGAESTSHPLGRYLALTSCSECHGQSFQGSPDGRMPDLRMVAAYSAEGFARLMREGIGLGDRELDLMGDVSRSRFSYLTDEEVGALYTYLSTLRNAAPTADG